MLKTYMILANVFSLFYFVNSDFVLPKCKKNDAECLLKMTVEMLPKFAVGIPEFKVLTTDPLFIESADASTQNLKLLVKNGTIRGVKDCIIEKSKLTDTKIIGQIMCDLTVDGLYDMKGKLLVITIEGKGEVHGKLNKVRFYGEGDLTTYTGKDGKKHWKVKSFKHSYTLTEKANLSFSNLFNGSEDLNKAVRDVIDQNPNEVISEIGSPAVESVARAMFENINNLFKIKAIDDLFLPE